MIASLHGAVLEKDPESLVVEVHGVGFRVFVPAPLLNTASLGQSLTLHTHLIVREDALMLVGFETREEREFFLHFLGVQGIGAKLALSAVATLSPEAVRRAVFAEQPEMFTRIPGVGKKTAQKIMLHLQDKISTGDALAPAAAFSDVDTEVLQALTTLGYSVIEAQAALQSIPRDAPQEIEARLRLALQYFS